MLILASTSPRRKELLKKIHKEFVVMDPHVDEKSFTTINSALPQAISKLKAYALFSKYPLDQVLACDTIVIFNDQVLGKPKNEEDAKAMLRKLSNNKHIVLSGYTYIDKDKEINRTVKTIVYFNKLDEETISNYVKEKKPLDKAGAYGIQDEGFDLIKKIDGSYDNVMGLPSEDIAKYCFNKTI